MIFRNVYYGQCQKNEEPYKSLTCSRNVPDISVVRNMLPETMSTGTVDCETTGLEYSPSKTAKILIAFSHLLPARGSLRSVQEATDLYSVPNSLDDGIAPLYKYTYSQILSAAILRLSSSYIKLLSYANMFTSATSDLLIIFSNIFAATSKIYSKQLSTGSLASHKTTSPLCKLFKSANSYSSSQTIYLHNSLAWNPRSYQMILTLLALCLLCVDASPEFGE